MLSERAALAVLGAVPAPTATLGASIVVPLLAAASGGATEGAVVLAGKAEKMVAVNAFRDLLN